MQTFRLSFLVLATFLVTSAQAQYKEYKLSAKGDTINAVTKAGVKEGKWVIRIDEIRGEPGYEEEGIYKKGAKEGAWRRYNLQGDLIAVENYLNGGKDGTQTYFTYLGDLEHEESWRGYNPESPYDTIAIYGTGSNEIIDYKIVKAEQYSVKQGDWKYYDPTTGQLLRTEHWERNNIVQPNATKKAVAATEAKKPDKTPEMLEWERKNKGKKKVMRDGSTGM